MAEHIAEKIQSADWKSEKHVPVITCPDKVEPDEWTRVTITLGAEIAHPNTTEHHIRWLKAFFVPDGGKFAYDLGTFEFNAHGESTDGPNTGPVYTTTRRPSPSRPPKRARSTRWPTATSTACGNRPSGWSWLNQSPYVVP